MELKDPLGARTVDAGEPSAADIDAYRTLSADMASGVGMVSTVHRRRDNAATVSGFLSVSYDPPTLMVSLYEQSRICDAVTGSGTWALSLLTGEQLGTANWLASPGNPVEGLLNQVPFRRGPATGAPILPGALAWFELKTVAASCQRRRACRSRAAATACGPRPCPYSGPGARVSPGRRAGGPR